MVKVEQGKFLKDIKVVGELITNRVIALDTSYLKLVSLNNKQYLVGFASQHDLLVKIGENKLEDFSVNVEYSKLLSLVGYLNTDVNLAVDNNGVEITDGSVETYLSNIMSDNTDLEDITHILEDAGNLNGDRIKVKRDDFFNTLRYLRGIQERDERTDIETGVMFTKEYSYVIGELYAVRHQFGLDYDLVLDGHTTRVMLSLIGGSDVEEFEIARKDGVTYFFVGDNVYRVDGLTDDIDDEYTQIFNHRETENIITMDKKECLRILNLTKVLTDSVESDITFDVAGKKGRIFTKTQNGDLVDSEFVAEQCEDVAFNVSVEDMVSIISKLPQDVAEELYLEVVNVPEEDRYEENEILHFKHDLGDCVFSINTDIG